jgi:hypothetical protein
MVEHPSPTCRRLMFNQSIVLEPLSHKAARSYFRHAHNIKAIMNNSVVVIASGYRLDDPGVGVGVPVLSRIFSISSRLALVSTQPPIHWVLGAISPGIKRPGREADRSPPTSAKAKKMLIYTSIPPYDLMA